MTESGGLSIGDMVRTEEPAIFRNRKLLSTSRIVDEGRIVGREEQIQSYVTLLQSLKTGDTPPNILVYGPSGTGKSLITHRVASEFQRVLDESGKTLAIVELNCQWLNTNYQAAVELAESLPEEAGSITVQGKSTQKVLKEFFKRLEENFDASLVVVDEVDHLVNPVDNTKEPAYSSLLYQLSRAEDLTNIETFGVIAITNAPDFVEELDPRVNSSFNPRDIVFTDYDANQLRQILYRREDAFVEGVLSDDVIPYAAALAAQDHGDARKAVDLLRTAGALALDEEAERVYKHHVDRAQEEVERDRLLEQANGYSSGKKLVLFSTAAVHAWSSESIDSVPNPVMQEVYSFMCDIADLSEKSQPTLSRYVDEFEQGGLIETSHTSKGSSSGMYRQIKMTRSSELLVETLCENDSGIMTLVDDRELIASVVDTKLNEFYN